MVFLALDEASISAAEAGVFGLAHLVERLAEMAHDVELVEQNRCLRRFVFGDVAERLPHVHHGELDFAALFEPQPVVERRHAGLGTILAAEPDRPLANQVAHHAAIAVALADRDLVDADRSGTGRARTLELGPHVLFLQRLDRVPVEPELLGDIEDRCLPAAAADIECKAFGEVRTVRQKIQPFALHCATTAARHPTHFDFENNPKASARQIANRSYPPVVPAVSNPPAAAANCFFERRSSRTIRTSGSPNTPRTVTFARKPANEYPSDRRRCRFPDLVIPQHAKIEPASKPRKSLSTSISAAMIPQNHPLDSLKTQKNLLPMSHWQSLPRHDVGTNRRKPIMTAK